MSHSATATIKFFEEINGKVFWNYGNEFFIETEEYGNFIYSDPDYIGGKNVIQTVFLTKQDWEGVCNIPYAHSKGKKNIMKLLKEDTKVFI